MMRQIKRDDGIKLANGRPAILSAVELPGGKFEVMLLTKDATADEIRSAQCETEKVALLIFNEMRDQYHVPELTGRYKKLAADLKDALAYGLEHAGTDDGGTCNFDAPTLHLPRWNQKMVEAAAKEAGTGCFQWKAFSKSVYVFSVPGVGQGYTRTCAAEAMSDFLKDRGYDAGMYYQMD